VSIGAPERTGWALQSNINREAYIARGCTRSCNYSSVYLLDQPIFIWITVLIRAAAFAAVIPTRQWARCCLL